ncbi:MAG: NAD(P)H-hydrate dehydratase [Lachnospiraceae bacterium]|nr:NAD(P)H-hydrate dehydratase [Lachnospiraceae bacterium]
MLKYVVTAAQMQSADRHTSDETGIPSLVLMERAALAVADEICHYFQETDDIHGKKVCIACGSGNNGGDGFALGRILQERGCDVRFFMVQEKASSDSTQIQQSIIHKLGMSISTGKPENEYDIIIDAMFGTGLKRTITGAYAELIMHLNSLGGLKVAVDIPSGIDSDWGKVHGIAFRADITVTFAFLKWGHMIYPGREYCGRTVLYDIGIGEREFAGILPFGCYLEPSDIISLLPKRSADSHKGTYHRAGIIAGSDAIGGAVVLCASATMRTGVGYTKVLTAKANRIPLLKHSPEALIYAYDDLDEQMNSSINELMDCTAVAIGPGLGLTEHTARLLDLVLEQYDGNLILDADALTIMANHSDLFEKCKKYSQDARKNKKQVVLTPHKKEFCRLTGLSVDSDIALFHEKALQLAVEYGMIVVLKDAATRVYLPNGKVYINTTGNSGMATAGSGDVLTGILAGLLAQMSETEFTVPLGVYLHGACGDWCISGGNPHSLTAFDMVEAMKHVFKGET